MPKTTWLQKPRDPTGAAVEQMFGSGKEMNMSELSRRSGVAYPTCAGYRNRSLDFASCKLETFARLCEGRELSDTEIAKLVKTFYQGKGRR